VGDVRHPVRQLIEREEAERLAFAKDEVGCGNFPPLRSEEQLRRDDLRQEGPRRPARRWIRRACAVLYGAVWLSGSIRRRVSTACTWQGTQRTVMRLKSGLGGEECGGPVGSQFQCQAPTL
jgi:hypothetical protein